MPELPARPSVEHLRKAAKRAARANAIPLASAQRALAQSYGFTSWAALMRAAGERAHHPAPAPPLLAAIRDGDVARAERLLDGGANPRIGDGVDLPLHVAARRGDVALVERMIAAGALVWQTDGAHRTALDAARLGRSPRRSEIVALLDRSVIADPSFRAAVRAIHAGDTETLERILTARPALMHARNVGPEAYRRAQRFDYFRDPKLFWFVANNPILVKRMPANLVDVVRVMLSRGVDQEDLDYALGLVMTGMQLREQGLQRPVLDALLDAGARVTEHAMEMAAGHRELDAVRAVLARGTPLTAPIAAALGDRAALAVLLQRASAADVQAAFGLAVYNGELDAARLALAAGADVNGPFPVHAHGSALHHAAANDMPDMIAFLLAYGARSDARDTLWDATPIDWARYLGKASAVAALEAASA
jgi:peptide-methionine (S)-S-oxide reductase